MNDLPVTPLYLTHPTPCQTPWRDGDPTQCKFNATSGHMTGGHTTLWSTSHTTTPLEFTSCGVSSPLPIRTPARKRTTAPTSNAASCANSTQSSKVRYSGPVCRSRPHAGSKRGWGRACGLHVRKVQVCPHVQGTGVCPHVQGTGVCLHVQGTGVCLHVQGTGVCVHTPTE